MADRRPVHVGIPHRRRRHGYLGRPSPRPNHRSCDDRIGYPNKPGADENRRPMIAAALTTPVPTVGLTSEEAHHRLADSGGNVVQDAARTPVSRALSKFWAPIPATGAWRIRRSFRRRRPARLQRRPGLLQEGRAQATLEALKSRMAISASGRRNGIWKTLAATDLVQGDVVKLSLGAVVPADVKLIDGSVLVDQSMLTGESVPTEAGPGFKTFASALIRRGEAVGEVVATGARTKFGPSAELIRATHVVAVRIRRHDSSMKTTLLALARGAIGLVALASAEHRPTRLNPPPHRSPSANPGSATDKPRRPTPRRSAA